MQIDPPPASLAAPCEAMRLIDAGATLGTLLAADVELAGQYAECSARHAGLAEWARTVTSKKPLK